MTITFDNENQQHPVRIDPEDGRPPIWVPTTSLGTMAQQATDLYTQVAFLMAMQPQLLNAEARKVN